MVNLNKKRLSRIIRESIDAIGNQEKYERLMSSMENLADTCDQITKLVDSFYDNASDFPSDEVNDESIIKSNPNKIGKLIDLMDDFDFTRRDVLKKLNELR